MSVRAGWPLRTLAAVVVGYVMAVAVVPPDDSRVSGEPDDAESVQRVKTSMPPAPKYDRAPVAWTAEHVPPPDLLGAPPPLRGARETVASADEVDLILVSDAGHDRARATMDRWMDRWYRRLDPAVPAAAR